MTQQHPAQLDKQACWKKKCPRPYAHQASRAQSAPTGMVALLAITCCGYGLRLHGHALLHACPDSAFNPAALQAHQPSRLFLLPCTFCMVFSSSCNPHTAPSHRRASMLRQLADQTLLFNTPQIQSSRQRQSVLSSRLAPTPSPTSAIVHLH